MTDDITRVMTAGEKFTTGGPTLVLRTGAGPGTLGLPTATALYAGLTTGPTVPTVTFVFTLVRPTAQSPSAGATTGPRGGVTSPGDWPAGATVAGGGDRDGTGGAGAGMTEEETLVTTATQ